jgi:hypothetical protein
MDSEVVRRSSREGVLERIASGSPDFPNDSSDRTWAEQTLGLCKNLNAPVVDYDSEKQETTLEKYGYRAQKDLKTNDPAKFAEWVTNAYNDAKNYPEYNGIPINLSVERVSLGSASATCEVKAVFNELVGLNEGSNKYSTSLVFTYQHDYSDDGPFDSSKAVKEQLNSLKYALRVYFKQEKMKIDGNCLLIGVNENKK